MTTTRFILPVLLAVAVFTTTAGCETMKEHRKVSGAVLGGAAGAATGAIIGHQSGHRTEGALIGAAAGAALGTGVGWWLDRRAKEFEKVEDVEVDKVEKGQVQTPSGEPVPAHVTLRLSEDVFFEQGSSAITDRGTRRVAEVASLLRQSPDAIIHVKGYTSSEGPDEYNMRLSENRARVVANQLVANGVDPARITALGMGESNPIASNQTEAGRAKNRRVEIEVYPTKDSVK